MIRNTNEVHTRNDLQIAIDLKRPVTIDYFRADGTRTVRVIEPYEITETSRGHALVRAMDRLSREVRGFRIDRLYAYRMAPARGRFTVPRTMSPEAFTEPPKAPGTASWSALPVVDSIDAEWADWNELIFDPDAPVPYLPADLEA